MNMNKSMKKRVYGVIGVRSIASNWNADFDNYPKAFSDGQIFGSSQSFKYTMKKLWDENDELVFCLKSRKWKVEKNGNNEEEFGAAIPEEDAEKLTHVGKVIDYLKSKGYGDDGSAPPAARSVGGPFFSASKISVFPKKRAASVF